MNKVILIGNITRDIELRNTQSGKVVASFGLATSERYLDQNGQKQEKTDFHNLVAWSKTAEIISKYCLKGKKIGVIGKLQTTNYTGQDGVKRYNTEIIVSEIEFLSPVEKPKEQPMKENEPIDIPEEPEEDDIRVENIPF